MENYLKKWHTEIDKIKTIILQGQAVVFTSTAFHRLYSRISPQGGVSCAYPQPSTEEEAEKDLSQLADDLQIYQGEVAQAMMDHSTLRGQ